MTNFVDTTLRGIDERLEELRDEVKKLEAAKAALSGLRRGPARPAGRARSRAAAPSSNGEGAPRRARRRPGRPRGSRGGNTRSKQALELVRTEPGITIPQIAERLGIEPNYLYRVMPRLVGEGEIRREGQGWHPAGAAAAGENGSSAAA